ncbi:MAG: PH domain-containing protein [Candidatus Methanomethylophilaceae archaeon]
MDEGYRTLNPKSKISMYIGYVIVFVILSALFVFILSYREQVESFLFRYLMGVYFVALLVYLIYMIVAPLLYYSHFRYIITSDRIDVRYGVIIIHHTVVPIERVHQVEVTRGPINNMLGLANVTVTTAGGTADIRFLEISEAERIAEELNSLINKIIGDRK